MAINNTVDPYKIPKKMSREQLEYWCLFGIAVANKSAKQTELKMKALLRDLPGFAGETPFTQIKWALHGKYLRQAIVKHKLGQYKRIYRAFKEVIKLDLDNISVESLESVHGIGPKTARMIMLYYDPNADCVPLDTHVLKYLKKIGVPDVPKNTPSAGKTYKRLEDAFKAQAFSLGKSVRELDTEVWLSYAQK